MSPHTSLCRSLTCHPTTGTAIPTSSIVRQRESCRSREYLRAYSQGVCVSTVDTVRDKIKSERISFKDTVTDTVITHRQHRTPSIRGARIPPVVDSSTSTNNVGTYVIILVSLVIILGNVRIFHDIIVIFELVECHA